MCYCSKPLRVGKHLHENPPAEKILNIEQKPDIWTQCSNEGWSPIFGLAFDLARAFTQCANTAGKLGNESEFSIFP